MPSSTVGTHHIRPRKFAGSSGDAEARERGMVVSAQAGTDKTGEECRMLLRHFRLGYLCGFGFFFRALKVQGEEPL
jgi:hypothetical protein